MTFRYEQRKIKEGYTYIIGCDEVGRGSLAGPVVAAAVVLPSIKYNVLGIKQIHPVKSSKAGIPIPSGLFNRVKDSKLLSPNKRAELSEIIKQYAVWSIGLVSQKVIDRINIHYATLLAMRKAVEELLFFLSHCESQAKQSKNGKIATFPAVARNDSLVAIDGQFTIPGIDIHQEAVIDGDNKVLSIAAASIVAKVYRDQLMLDLHQHYPIYNFAQHKGYGTLQHRKMILAHGLSPIHRLSFCDHLV